MAKGIMKGQLLSDSTRNMMDSKSYTKNTQLIKKSYTRQLFTFLNKC